MVRFCVSAFAADVFHMKRDLSLALESGADAVHIDVMDGHFVPLFGFNQMWIREMLAWDERCNDIHLMTEVSEEMLERFQELPVKRITLHAEAGIQGEITAMLKRIQRSGKEAGVAVSPQTAVEEVLPYLPYIKEVLVMSTRPGTENSPFYEQVYEKIRKMRELIRKSGRETGIAVDGSLNEERAVRCIESGADRIIMGRAFYTEADKKGMIGRVRGAFAGDL